LKNNTSSLEAFTQDIKKKLSTKETKEIEASFLYVTKNNRISKPTNSYSPQIIASSAGKKRKKSLPTRTTEDDVVVVSEEKAEKKQERERMNHFLQLQHIHNYFHSRK
jgi:CDP-glycerol glycerophosphotransferase (TagB/SpsB family)